MPCAMPRRPICWMAGLPVHRLQRLMGHQDLHTTLRYVHWVPAEPAGQADFDLIGQLGVEHE